MVPLNLWKPNYASSTIAPINGSLQIPCANIVGGCGGSSSSSVTSLNSATGTITVQGAGSTTVSTSGGTITVSSSLPQALGTGNSPTFGGETVNGNVTSTGAAITGETDFGLTSSYPNIVVANTNFTELGAYMNALCNQNVSGTLIFVPAMLPASSTFTTQLKETQRCTYEGVGGGGTTWTWGGASSTPPINIDVSSLPHTVGGGIEDISLVNGNSTTTNSAPYIGVEASGNSVNTSGGAHGLIQYDTFVGWRHVRLDEASGTYAVAINDNSFHANNYCVYAEPSSNSGESVEGTQNWCVDPATTLQAPVATLVQTSSVEDAYFDQLTTDNSTVQVNGNSSVSISHLETENSGGTYGATYR